MLFVFVFIRKEGGNDRKMKTEEKKGRDEYLFIYLWFGNYLAHFSFSYIWLVFSYVLLIEAVGYHLLATATHVLA